MLDITVASAAGESFEWNGRTWAPHSEAMTTGEMAAYLRLVAFAYDSESACMLAGGGTFDVSGRRDTFRTFTVAQSGAGRVRLYRATDTRPLRNGSVW